MKRKGRLKKFLENAVRDVPEISLVKVAFLGEITDVLVVVAGEGRREVKKKALEVIGRMTDEFPDFLFDFLVLSAADARHAHGWGADIVVARPAA